MEGSEAVSGDGVWLALTDEQVLKLYEIEDFIENLDLDAVMHGYRYPADELEWIQDRLTQLVIGG